MIRARIWRDDLHRRYIATGDGSMVVEPGETCILVVGKDLDARLLAALTQEVQPVEVVPESAPGFRVTFREASK